MLTMYPMDLEEVLWAKGKQMLTDTIREHYENNQPLNEMLHEEAMQEFYHCCIVGGMPASVKADLAKDSPIEQTEIRQMLLNSYIADMTKYANSQIQCAFLKHMILFRRSWQKTLKSSSIS